MKITVWLRRDPNSRARTLRTDVKYESFDDPALQNFGRKLVNAIESGGEPMEERSEK